MSANQKKFVIAWQRVGNASRMIPTDFEQYEITAAAAKEAGRELLKKPGLSILIPSAIIELSETELNALKSHAQVGSTLITIENEEFLVLPEVL